MHDVVQTGHGVVVQPQQAWAWISVTACCTSVVPVSEVVSDEFNELIELVRV